MNDGNRREDGLATHLLVGFICAVGVADLGNQVIFFLENEILGDSGQPLHHLQGQMDDRTLIPAR